MHLLTLLVFMRLLTLSECLVCMYLLTLLNVCFYSVYAFTDTEGVFSVYALLTLLSEFS